MKIKLPHQFHNVAVETIVGCKRYDATENGKTTQKFKAVDR